MKQNVSKHLKKIEGELTVDGTEVILALSWREREESKEKVRRFEEENPGIPVPYLIISFLAVETEANAGKGVDWVGMEEDDGEMKYIHKSELDD